MTPTLRHTVRGTWAVSVVWTFWWVRSIQRTRRGADDHARHKQVNPDSYWKRFIFFFSHISGRSIIFIWLLILTIFFKVINETVTRKADSSLARFCKRRLGLLSLLFSLLRRCYCGALKLIRFCQFIVLKIALTEPMHDCSIARLTNIHYNYAITHSTGLRSKTKWQIIARTWQFSVHESNQWFVALYSVCFNITSYKLFA